MIVHKADNNSAKYGALPNLHAEPHFVIFEIIVIAAVKQSLIDSLISHFVPYII